MIVGSVITTLEVPHEPGNFIKIREISGLELDDASELRSNRVVRNLALLGKETIDAIQDARGEVDTTVHDPKNDYDWGYLVKKAINSWEGPNYSSLPCTDENKILLDKKTLEWLVEEIVKRNVVPEGELETSVVSSIEG